MDEPQGYVTWNKRVPPKYILYDSTYIKYWD